MRTTTRASAVVFGLLLGCTGEVIQPGGDGPIPILPAGPEFACEEAPPVEAPMNRLTRDQFDNTLHDLLTLYVGPDRAVTVLDAAGPQHTLLPHDEAPPRDDNRFKRDYRRWDQTVSDIHVEGWYLTALAIGAELAANDRAALLGACGETVECARDFLHAFASRAYRHPIPNDSRARLDAVFGDAWSETALAESIAFVLLAPDFLYHVEEGAESVGGATYALDDYELAARMSYALWDSLPDDELWSAAEAGQLTRDDDALAAQVDRMLDDPRSRPALTRFFEDWLQLSVVENPADLSSNPAYMAFAGDDLPNDDLAGAGVQEIHDLIERLVFEDEGTVRDLLTTDLAPVRDPALARLYGMAEPWDGTSEPPRFAPSERSGLLSRFSLLATATLLTRPVHRGVLVREMILCDDLPAPPEGASSTTIQLEGLHSTREYYEALTEAPSTNCVQCHRDLINPLGFVMERYDSLGRLRTEETIFDRDTGEVLGAVPIDTTVEPSLFYGDDSRVSTPDELGDAIADSGKLEACLARNVFRFMFARQENVRTDGCALEDARVAGSDGRIRDLIGAMVLSRAFRLRTIEE